MNKKIPFKIERLHIIENSGPTKAFCDILIANTFMVKGLRVVEGRNGLFVSMPQEIGKDGKWHDTFYPVENEVMAFIKESILNEYHSKTGQQ